jgi:hypothetical protein
LAVASSEEGATVVSMLKVLDITFFLPFSCSRTGMGASRPEHVHD